LIKPFMKGFNSCCSFALVVIFIAGISVLPSCHRKREEDQDWGRKRVVAVVGRKKITAEDFLIDFELFPRPHMRKRGMEAKEAHINWMIRKKLFATEAEKKGYAARHPQLGRYLEWYRKKAARYQLYREKVRKRVRITEKAIREAFQKRQISIRARHLFAETLEGAQRLRERLQNGETFEEIAREIFSDSVLANNGGDLGYFSWGEMDEDFERAVYELEVGEISEPIRTRWGYHIIKVEDKRWRPLRSPMDYARERKYIRRILRLRQEQKLSLAYVKKVMEPLRVTLKARGFSTLARQFQAVFGKNARLLPPYLPNLYDPELRILETGLEDHRGDTLLVFKGGYWTIGDFLEKLAERPVWERPVYRGPRALIRDIKYMIRDEVLSQIALKKGLDTRREAREEFRTFKEDVLYQFFVYQAVDTIRVTPQEVRRYYENHPEEFREPEKVNIREILVRRREEAKELLERIRRGEDMAELARRYSIRKWAAANGGEFGYFPPGSHGEIGKVAFTLKVGELYGPLEVAGGPPHGGYSIFRVIGRKPAGRKPFEEVKDYIYQKILTARREKVLQRLESELRQKYFVQVNTDVLESIPVLDSFGQFIVVVPYYGY